MIPFAILSGSITDLDSEIFDLEFRILDLSLSGFTFRLSKKYGILKKAQTIRLSFFQFSIADYQTIELYDSSLQLEEEKDFYYVYHIHTSSDSFAACARILSSDYLHYIDLKLDGDDAALSEDLTGYPKDKEAIYSASRQEWKHKLFMHAQNHFYSSPQRLLYEKQVIESNLELAIELNSDELQDAFLTLPFSEFKDFYWNKQELTWHPLCNKQISCVYLGSQYCLHLFPSEEKLPALLDRAVQLHLKPVICFPPVKESNHSMLIYILAFLRKWVSRNSLNIQNAALELIINDWGMADYLANHYAESFQFSFGILLNKRRKDTRLAYKNGSEKQFSYLNENASNAKFMQTYLAEKWKITRYSYESCNYLFHIPAGKHILHLPFYQMNTGGHCTLYAACRNGARSMQTEVTHCPGYCKEQAFLYPDMLSMIGAANSLFGFDEHILYDADYFSALCRQSIRRIVLSFP